MKKRAFIGNTASSLFLLAFFVLFIGGMAISLTVDATENYSISAIEDVLPPEVTALNITPTEVDTSENDVIITVTVTITDDLSGACIVGENAWCTAYTNFGMEAILGTQQLNFSNWTRISGDYNDGTYTATATMPQWSKVGVWDISYLMLADNVGNYQRLKANDLSVSFPDSNLNVVNTAGASSVTIENEWRLVSSTGLTTATFLENTVVTRDDTEYFQFYKMVNQSYDVSDFNTENLRGESVGAIRFGIPGADLVFSKPVSISMRVDAKYSEQTLVIQSLGEGENEWASESSCTIVYHGNLIKKYRVDFDTGEVVPIRDSNGQIMWFMDPDDSSAYGTCDFTVTHASYFTINALPYIVTGPKDNSRSEVRVFSTDGVPVNSFQVYDTNLTSGINVAVGDINGDGNNEIVTSPRTGGGPHIRVFDVDGNNLGWDFYAYDENFRGGVNIAVGDIEGDGQAEIVTAPMANGGPNVRVFSLREGGIVPTTENFMAYDANFRGGIAISIGDLEGDGYGEIITTPTSRGGPHIRVFGLRDGRYVPVTLGVMAYAETFRGGINSCVGDVNSDGRDEIMTGIVSNGGPHVRIFGDKGVGTGVELISPGFMAYNPAHRGGVEVTSADIDGDGYSEIITGVGGDGSPLIRFYNQAGEQVATEFEAYTGAYKGGVTLAAGYF